MEEIIIKEKKEGEVAATKKLRKILIKVKKKRKTEKRKATYI